MKPFGDLEREEQLALFEAWLDGNPIEFYNFSYSQWFSGEPMWDEQVIYRIKPVQPSIDWDHVHPDYKYLAIDNNGASHLFRYKPAINNRSYWQAKNGIYMDNEIDATLFTSFKAGTCDWKDSLVERPKK